MIALIWSESKCSSWRLYIVRSLFDQLVECVLLIWYNESGAEALADFSKSSDLATLWLTHHVAYNRGGDECEY